MSVLTIGILGIAGALLAGADSYQSNSKRLILNAAIQRKNA